MKIFAAALFVVLAAFVPTFVPAQTPAEKSDAAQLEVLTKKIDEQNAKIDALSQQILKLQEQLSKPGVMIGESPSASASGASSGIDAAHPSGPTHVVTRGETLTSIAKAYKVGVEELQKYNHIENDRKLQIGQTIAIPTSGSPTPSASPTMPPTP